jgi:pimeloyl-ACP methyl ester carboxylesterase
MAETRTDRKPEMTGTAPSGLHHQQVEVRGLSIHVVQGGAVGKPALLFLHGWPEDWTAFEWLMFRLGREAHVVALDLPGIGASETPAPANDKRTLAGYVRGVVERLGLTDVTLVGHDVGGQVVYACLRDPPGGLARAVIMNVAIPGVDPWDEVKGNPAIWHFAFHAVPGLPEQLVAGRQAVYFDYFYDRLSARPGGVSARARETYVRAYSRPEALRTGFEWYRAFPQDEKDNRRAHADPVQIPVLYLRGENDPGLDLDRYVDGLRRAGLHDVRGRVVSNSGHFAMDEQPAEVLAALREFMGLAEPDVTPAGRPPRS